MTWPLDVFFGITWSQNIFFFCYFIIFEFYISSTNKTTFSSLKAWKIVKDIVKTPSLHSFAYRMDMYDTVYKHTNWIFLLIELKMIKYAIKTQAYTHTYLHSDCELPKKIKKLISELRLKRVVHPLHVHVNVIPLAKTKNRNGWISQLSAECLTNLQIIFRSKLKHKGNFPVEDICIYRVMN